MMMVSPVLQGYYAHQLQAFLGDLRARDLANRILEFALSRRGTHLDLKVE